MCGGTTLRAATIAAIQATAVTFLYCGFVFETSDSLGSPISGLCQVGQYSTLRLAECRRRSAIRCRSPSRVSGSHTLVAPLRTSHPSGSRLGVLSSQLVTAAPGRDPGPRKPFVPRRVHTSRSRSAIAQFHGSASSGPTRCGSRRGRNVTANGRDGGGAQSIGWFCQPQGGAAAAIP
jgi:hypothetical protein